MHYLAMLATALAAITAGVTANEGDYTIHYTRYKDLNCTIPFDKPDKLAASRCKSYKHSMPHYSYSYDWFPQWEGEQPWTQGNCQVAAWKGTRCSRSSMWYSVGAATPSFDAEGHGPCVSVPEGARSAWVKCWMGGQSGHVRGQNREDGDE